MGQEVLKRIQFLCNYFGCKASQWLGAGRQEAACRSYHNSGEMQSTKVSLFTKVTIPDNTVFLFIIQVHFLSIVSQERIKQIVSQFCLLTFISLFDLDRIAINYIICKRMQSVHDDFPTCFRSVSINFTLEYKLAFQALLFTLQTFA